MRLIDADALMHRMLEEMREAPNWDYAAGYRDAIKRVECMIGEEPTVAEDSNIPIKQPDQEPYAIIYGQNKAIAALAREIDDLKKELERSNEYALHHVNAYHELANKTEHVGKINSWNQIWTWFQGFKPLQDLREKVLTDADGQIGAASLMAETIAEYVNRFGE